MERVTSPATATPISHAEALIRDPRFAPREPDADGWAPAVPRPVPPLLTGVSGASEATLAAVEALEAVMLERFCRGYLHTCAELDHGISHPASEAANQEFLAYQDIEEAAALSLLDASVNDPADRMARLTAFLRNRALYFSRSREWRVFSLEECADMLDEEELAPAFKYLLGTNAAPAPHLPSGDELFPDKAAADYVNAKLYRAQHAGGTSREADAAYDEAYNRAQAAGTLMMATAPLSIAGIATRLGYIISEGFCHRASLWDDPVAPEREPIFPPTDAELVACGEGQNGGADALFRALACLHLGVERLAQREATPSRLGALLEESDRLFSESNDYPEDSPEHLALDKRSDELHREFLRAPIKGPADALVKLRWLSRGYHSGETGNETAVLAQFVRYFGGDPIAALTVDPRYDCAKVEDLTFSFDRQAAETKAAPPVLHAAE